MKKPIDPRIVVFIGVAFTSFAAIFIRLATAPPLVIAFYRLLFATAILSPWMAWEIRGRDFSVSVRDILATILGGVLLAVHFATWISSLSLTSIASATVLVNTQPVFLAIAAFLFLRERIGLWEAIAIVGAVGGSVVLALGESGSGSDGPAGDLLALGGAVSMAGYMIVGRLLRPRMGLVPYTWMVYGSAALVLFVTLVATGQPLGGHPATDYLLFGAMAVFCTLLGHSLMNWSLRYLNPTFIGTAALGEPVLAGSMALVLFSEVPALTTVVGGAIILLSIYAFTRFEARRVSARNRS